MLDAITKELLGDPLKIEELLKSFGYCNIKIRSTYIQFGRSNSSSPKSIVIQLRNNPRLYVTDYPKNIHSNLFTYISTQRHVTFSEVLSCVKNILGVDGFYGKYENNSIFGGFYDNIYNKNYSRTNDVYNDDILKHYVRAGNSRFARDNIPIEIQQEFNIMYDVESQSIVIPIYNPYGELIGVKARRNESIGADESKYYYLVPCAASQTLYGYAHNYNNLVHNIVYVFEGEKSVMQCCNYGVHNCVAMSSGSISSKQIALLIELEPKAVVFMHDVGYPFEAIQRNIKEFKEYSRFVEIPVGYWNYFDQQYPDKVSPSDMGKEKFMDIIDNEITMVGECEV